MKRSVMIRIETLRAGLSASLFEDEDVEALEEEEAEETLPSVDESEDETEEEESEMLMEGCLVTTPTRVELVYEETELTGMEGSISTIGFDCACPGLISMLRSGAVSTALVFEEGKRHTCVYDTPFSSFDVCVVTRRVKNDLLRTGVLELEYLIEIHGAQAERCKMRISVQ